MRFASNDHQELFPGFGASLLYRQKGGLVLERVRNSQGRWVECTAFLRPKSATRQSGAFQTYVSSPFGTTRRWKKLDKGKRYEWE